MGIVPIRIAGDPVLREKAKRVKKVDASIQRLIDDMIDTMRTRPASGWRRRRSGCHCASSSSKHPTTA